MGRSPLGVKHLGLGIKWNSLMNPKESSALHFKLVTWPYADSQSCYNPDKLRIKDGRQCSLIRKTQKKGQWTHPFAPGVTVTGHSNQRGVHSEWICCEHGKCWSITGAVCVTADLLVLGMIRSKRCVALLHVFQMSRVLGTDWMNFHEHLLPFLLDQHTFHRWRHWFTRPWQDWNTPAVSATREDLIWLITHQL